MAVLLNRLRSDEALMGAYQRGDNTAFEQLYRRHKDALYAFLYRHCPRPAIVDELAQDTWMAVIDSAESYQATAGFRTWLYRIAHNRTVDFWRRADNRHLGSEALPEPHAQDAQQGGSEVLTAIGQLPGEQKDALLLQEQGFTLHDIAAITGVGAETVKSRLRYAREQLRKQLGETL